MQVTPADAKKQRMLANHAIKWCRKVFTSGQSVSPVRIACGWVDVAVNDELVFPAVGLEQGQVYHWKWDTAVKLEWRALAAALPKEDKDVIFPNDEPLCGAIVYPGNAGAGHHFMGSKEAAWEFAFVGASGRIFAIRPDAKGKWPAKTAHVAVTEVGELLAPAGACAAAKAAGQRRFHGPPPPPGKTTSWFQYGGWDDEAFKANMARFIDHNTVPMIYALPSTSFPSADACYSPGQMGAHPGMPLAPVAADTPAAPGHSYYSATAADASPEAQDDAAGEYAHWARWGSSGGQWESPRAPARESSRWVATSRERAPATAHDDSANTDQGRDDVPRGQGRRP